MRGLEEMTSRSIYKILKYFPFSVIKILFNLKVQHPLGSGRIILAKTLYLIIQNDEENEYSVLNEINDTCWHTLVMWFFTKR